VLLAQVERVYGRCRMNAAADPSSGLAKNDPAMRAKIEDFLYLEADLLDEWRIEEWFALFAEGATYEVPPTGEADETDPATSLFYIADDYVRLRERVGRLMKKEAHSEFPRSRQRHVISNVRITGMTEGVADVACNFVTYRAKRGVVDTYYGKHLYRIDCAASPWRIRSKRSVLGMDMLYPGKLTIII
jgi:p-cumate 2,3-dioxygenase subunit beta